TSAHVTERRRDNPIHHSTRRTPHRPRDSEHLRDPTLRFRRPEGDRAFIAPQSSAEGFSERHGARHLHVLLQPGTAGAIMVLGLSDSPCLLSAPSPVSTSICSPPR